jgi:hypothetical protein
MHSPYGQATFVTSRPIPLAPAGLLPDRAMAPLWICPANAVHTIGMLFAFDLVLIDKDFKVVGIRPFRITMPNRKVESVIELPAHSIFRSRTQIGDQLTIERYDPKKAPPEETDTVLAGPPKPDDLTALMSRGAVVPIAPQRVNRERPRTRATSKVN